MKNPIRRSALAALMALLVLPASVAFALDTELSDGEIRKVDRQQQKLTIRHGPLRNLDMPGMTMVFGVKDPAMLEGLAPGSKVRFQAESINGKLVVTRIENAGGR